MLCLCFYSFVPSVHCQFIFEESYSDNDGVCHFGCIGRRIGHTMQ